MKDFQILLIEQNFLIVFWNNDINTLGQYTGLKDKNGKLIYEGDILKSRYSDIMRYDVVYRNAGLELRVYSIDHKETMDYLHIGEDVESIGLYEVIGNIHDNPELLESE